VSRLIRRLVAPTNDVRSTITTQVARCSTAASISFELPDDDRLLADVIEAIYQVHSYQEPVIRVQDMLASRTKGLDDKDNPHRWWNTSGDWKKAPTP
jgi:hypothetical protein